METKVCSKCNQEKLATREFFPFSARAKDNKLAGHCLTCDYSYRRAWCKNTKERDKYKRILKGSRAEGRRSNHIPLCISAEELRTFVSTHSGICDMWPCSEKAEAFDHDHATGKLRGWLCQIHNRSLGGFRDSVVELRAAIAYLEKSLGA